MGEDVSDDRYITVREHVELRERTAIVEATLAQVPQQLARIEALLSARREERVDHSALAAHRLLDDLPTIIQSAKQGVGGVSPILIAFAIVGAMAIGALAYRIATGG